MARARQWGKSSVKNGSFGNDLNGMRGPLIAAGFERRRWAACCLSWRFSSSGTRRGGDQGTAGWLQFQSHSIELTAVSSSGVFTDHDKDGDDDGNWLNRMKVLAFDNCLPIQLLSEPNVHMVQVNNYKSHSPLSCVTPMTQAQCCKLCISISSLDQPSSLLQILSLPRLTNQDTKALGVTCPQGR